MSRSRKKVMVIYGGDSCEHEVSKMTAQSIIDNLDRQSFDVGEIYVDKKGKFDHSLLDSADVVFLAFHGENYEDGKFQKYLDKKGIKYTGSGALSSRINMDKKVQKEHFLKAGLKVADYFCVSVEIGAQAIDQLINKKLTYPVFVKPRNAGSSIGISKVEKSQHLAKAIGEAGKISPKLIIEKAIIKPREIEVGVLGNSELEISEPGEILSNGNFYSYQTKYFKPFETQESVKDLDQKLQQKITDWSDRAYRATGCCGYARVDFLVDMSDNLYINEINTLPGFTSISMYPKLMKSRGYDYPKLLTKIVDLALAKSK